MKMTNQVTFSEILSSARRGNIKELKGRMYRANRLAKRATGNTRCRLYEIKNHAISQLLIVGAARVNSFVTWPEPLLGFDLEGGGRLHIKPAGLTLQAMDVVVQQLEQIVRIEDVAAQEEVKRH